MLAPVFNLVPKYLGSLGLTSVQSCNGKWLIEQEFGIPSYHEPRPE
jgi:hypothetical protein